MPLAGFFLFSCTLFVLDSYFFLCLDCPAFCLLSSYLHHNTNINAPGGFRTATPASERLQTYSLGFEPARPATDWPQTLALDRSATGIGQGTGSPDRPARSESLYEVRYPVFYTKTHFNIMLSSISDLSCRISLQVYFLTISMNFSTSPYVLRIPSI